MLKRLAAALLEARYAEVLPGELIYDGHAGPFLQALLTACSHDLCARSIVLLICCSLPLKILCALSPAARIVTHDLLTCRTLSAACLYAGSWPPCMQTAAVVPDVLHSYAATQAKCQG